MMFRLVVTPTFVQLMPLPPVGRIRGMCRRRKGCPKRCRKISHSSQESSRDELSNFQPFDRFKKLRQSFKYWPLGFLKNPEVFPRRNYGSLGRNRRVWQRKCDAWIGYCTGYDVRVIASRVAMMVAANYIEEPDYDDDYQYRPMTYSPYLLMMDGYFLSYFMSVISTSDVFLSGFYKRHAAWNTLDTQSSLTVVIQLQKKPVRHFLDRIGNGIVAVTVSEKIESEHALSWLSTLGGAFSALGDLSQTWALEAGRISFAQLRLACMMGDPLIASRCRLYAAISLLQQGHLKWARMIIQREFNYAKSLPPGQDPRLQRMCHGIWAKLTYSYSLRKLSRRVRKVVLRNE